MMYKRIFDFWLTLIAFAILLPIFLALSIAIKIDSQGPIIFKQRRIGKDKKEFFIYKFRTMRFEAPKDMPTHMLNNPDIYITKVGRFLRKSSLDELPQIINIIKGEMSIIGPRPALWNQFDLIEERDRYGVNEIYPGLTGWAQVNGRDELPVEVKAKLDGEYLQKMSITFDVKVFLKTIFSVLRSEGIKEGVSRTSKEASSKIS